MPRITRLLAVLAVVAATLVVAGCSGEGSGAEPVEADFVTGTADDFLASLEGSGRPAVVNVWASWCLPCRSEAPLLAAAARTHGEEVRFVGVVVEDDAGPAGRFVEEFGLDFEHWFDPDRRIPARLGGVGVPITYFVDAGGEIRSTHLGVLDERTLAFGIDELLGA